MRTKAILALDLLEQELEIIDQVQKSRLMGGGETWTIDGVTYYRDSPNDPWTAPTMADATVYGSSSGNSSNGNYSQPYSSNGNYSYNGGSQ